MSPCSTTKGTETVKEQHPNGTRRRRRGRLGLAAALLGICVAAVSAAPAGAAFGIKAFDGQVSASPAGDAFTQAAGHPFSGSATIAFNSHPDPDFGAEAPDGDPKDLEVELPPGLVGNPNAVPTCARSEFFSSRRAGTGTDCPVESQVGIASIELLGGVRFVSAVWNLEPSPGSPATFGFSFVGVRIVAEAEVRTGGDYGVTLSFPKINQALQILNSSMTLWGVPADPGHDIQRCAVPSGFVTPEACVDGEPDDPLQRPNSVNLAPKPFLTNPTACTAVGVGLTTNLRANSWQDPGVIQHASFESHLPPGYPEPQASWGAPQGPSGCENVPFDVEADVQPTSKAADSPTGLTVNLHMPQDGLSDPGGLATAHLKRAVVSLPAGMAVNPAAADGLGSCTRAQIDLNGADPANCPESSKIGSLEISTPLLDHAIEGSVYLAKQGENKFGSMLALYLAAYDPETGVVIKLPGKVEADPNTGQLTTSFDDQPELPFEDLTVEFSGGGRAALLNPPSCGTYATSSEFTPWSDTASLHTNSSFQITQGPNGRPCPDGKFDPRLNAGTANPVAGAYSPFQLALSREDGTPRLRGLTVTLPEGLTGKLAGIPYCPDSALGAVSGAEGTGAAQIASPSCPVASQIGTVSVGAGADPNPFYLDTGKAYLAGPYEGAPLSMAFVTPVVAGPFDLGSVLVRTALRVNPETAQLTAVSDPLPAIVHGIPVDLRDVRVSIDRTDFTLNPTSCNPMEVASTITSAQGAVANPSSRFQVGSCERLPFKPKLAIRLMGKTHRSAHPKLRATLTMPKGGANIARAQVTLPKTEFLENAHIKTICTRVQYAARTCPAQSVYGYAKAWSPLLDKPLEGPVYLRSSNNPLPDLVASLDGQIHVDLVGRIDAVNARIRNTFDLVPDAPVSKFVLTMQGGKKGLLVNNTELCKAKPRASVKFDAHNGKVSDYSPVVKADCGEKRKKR